MKKRRVGALLVAITCVGVSHAALVAEWSFDDQTLENSGLSAGYHDGSVVSGSAAIPVDGTVVFSTNTPSGDGFALDLSSASDYMMIANSSTNYAEYVNSFDAAMNYSYSMWVRNPTNTWVGYGSIAAKGYEAWNQDGSLKVGFELRAQNFTTAATGVRVEAWGSVSAADPAPYTDLTTSEAWHLLTYTYDANASNLTLYIDGTLRAAVTNSVIKPAPGNLLLFGAVEGEEGVKQSDCMYDNIQFYDHVLTESEVADLYIQQTWCYVKPDVIALELTAPDTLVTGAVEVTYMSYTNVEVNVSFSNETHVGAFSVLESVPLVLTNASPATTPINIVFDADLAGVMTNGTVASCTAVIAWNEVGSSAVTEVEVPVSLAFEIPAMGIELSLEELGANPDAVNPLNLSVLGPLDWVMLGQDGLISSRNEMAGADFIGDVSVTGGHGAFAGNAYINAWTNGTVMMTTTNAQGNWEAQSLDGSISYAVTGLVPADYTMKVFCSKYRATAKLSASKGGGSSSEEFTLNGTGNGTRYGVFTIEFTIDELGESLDIVYEPTAHNSRGGNVGMTAISLEREQLPPGTVGDMSIAIVSEGTEAALSWQGTEGYLYAVEATDNITLENWSDIAADIPGAGLMTITNTLLGDVLFYRSYLQD